MVAAAAMVFACGAVALLALSSSSSEQTNNNTASFAEKSAWLQESLAAHGPHFEMLNGTSAVAAAGSAEMPSDSSGGSASSFDSAKILAMVQKIKFPTSWDSFQETFGAHLYWTLFIFFLALCTLIFVRFVRPRMSVDESDSFADIDPNDLASKIILVPGEEQFFHSEEPFTSSMWEVLFCGCGNRVWKMGVTNKRIVAQKVESTCFGSCQLTCREDAWPIENVSKVSVISGEFWGYTIPSLWDMASKYLFVTLFFDLAHGIVRETLKDVFGPEATDPTVAKAIVLMNVLFYAVCNVLFFLAIIYSIAVMSLIIWPHSMVKVYLTRDMEDEGVGIKCCGCGNPNSKPMEAFTFKTVHSYKAYQCIMAARAGASKPDHTSAVAPKEADSMK
jgi:hypothetical protein